MDRNLTHAPHVSAKGDPLACGDLIAWRRFAYGRAAAEDGDFAAAAEMFEQALDKAPDWAPAWFALAEARQALGDPAGAAEAFRKTLEADPADAQGAGARRALIGAGEPPTALPQAYVRRLFDDYAPRFETHLIDNLDYRGPALIMEALDAAAPGRRFASALDIGCGTGLMGEAFRARVDRLTGVDLSPAMIAKARVRGLYDALAAADAVSWLMRPPAQAFDCVVAADALPYFGALEPFFAACRRALAVGGLFAFSVETFDGDGFRLGPAMRFAHGLGYVKTTSEACRLRPLHIRPRGVRREAGIETPGLICVFEASSSSGRSVA